MCVRSSFTFITLEVDDENSSYGTEEGGEQNLEGPSLFEGGMSTDGGAQFEGCGLLYIFVLDSVDSPQYSVQGSLICYKHVLCSDRDGEEYDSDDAF